MSQRGRHATHRVRPHRQKRSSSRKLETDGSADLSYGLPGVARFRVNVFRQRGTYAIVMRVIPMDIPGFEKLNLPAVVAGSREFEERNRSCDWPDRFGKIFDAGRILDQDEHGEGVSHFTIEDPIEFLHRHKKSTIHQRELHSDTPTFGLALRAALRQAPKVILVGEMRDRETIEIALEAAETGHLVMSTLHTIDASKTVERIIGVFPLADQQSVRTRLQGVPLHRFAAVAPEEGRQGRVAAVEILKATMRTRDYVEKGEGEGKTLLDAMRDGDTEGMQHFDGVIENDSRRQVDFETGFQFSTNPGNMRLELPDYLENPNVNATEKAPGRSGLPSSKSNRSVCRLPRAAGCRFLGFLAQSILQFRVHAWP